MCKGMVPHFRFERSNDARKSPSPKASFGIISAVGVLALIGCGTGTHGNNERLGTSATPTAGWPSDQSPDVSAADPTYSTSPASTSSPQPARALPTTAPVVVASPATVATPGSCHATGSGLYVLPDPSCTPGVTNPAVSQANIDQTICRSGWTSTVRPPESYTEPLKYQQMDAYGDSGSASNFEEDHLIPLELGGSPASPKNLWPEPGASPNPKDAVEDAANQAVCDGQLRLTVAQEAIANNWIALGQQLGLSESSSAPAQAPAPATGSGTCTVTASYSTQYRDYDIYVHSNQPDQRVNVSTSGGATASYHTDSSGYADVYLHATQSDTGQRVTATVGSASCTTIL
jgi:hypothetical protein